MTTHDKSTVRQMVDEYSISGVVIELVSILEKCRPAIQSPAEVIERFNNVSNALGSAVDLLQEIGR